MTKLYFHATHPALIARQKRADARLKTAKKAIARHR
jgi:hypothetical protein